MPATRVLSPGRVLATGLLLLGAAGLPGGVGTALAAPAAVTSAAPGSFVSLPLAGRVPESAGQTGGTYHVEATLPPGWTLLSDAVEVGRGPTLLNVYVPEDARAGTQALTFRLSGDGLAPLDVTAHVEVPARPGFTLDFPASGRVRPGEQRTFAAQVTNTGNAPDTVALSVEGSATVTPARVTLAPGESASVQVAYTHKGLGNADSVTLSAASTVTPELRRDAILALGVGYAAAGSGPQLTWQVSVSPQVTYDSAPPAPATATAGGATSTTPELPGLPTTTPAPGADPDGGAWFWDGGVSASIGGALSDYATGSAGYSVMRRPDGTVSDTARAEVRWAETSVVLSSSDALSGVGVGVNYTRGDYTFGVSAARQAAETPGGDAVYTVGAGVTHTSGVTLSAAQQFGGQHTTAFGVSWRRQLGAYAPAVGVYAVRRDDRFGVVATQGLGYENRALLVRQDYVYDSLSGAHALNVKVSSRQVAPIGVSATAGVSHVQGVTRYSVSGQATWTPDDSVQASVVAGYGSDGFSSRVAASKAWALGRTTLTLEGQATYAQGAAGTDVQLTSRTPVGDGEVLLRGLAGYQGGALVYGAGAGYVRGALRAAAGVQVQAGATLLTASAGFRPVTGVQGSVDLKLTHTDAGTAWQVQGSAGYAAGRWNAALTGGYTSADPATGAAGTVLYGAAIGVRVLETVQVSASAQQGGGNTRVRLGASFTPGGALSTPDAVVAAFGGRHAGTADIQAFLDANRNGTRDAGEGPVAIRLKVGPGELGTDAQGRGHVQVRPGAYRVELADGVDAQYVLAPLAPVTVPLKGRVAVVVPVQQVGAVQGQVRDDSGQPLGGVPVSVVGPQGETVAVTDAEGRYRVGMLGFGQYTVVPRTDAAYTAPQPGTVQLDTAHALVTADFTAAAIVETRGLDTTGTEVTVWLPETPVPPGVTVPLVVRVTPGADRVTLDDPEVALTHVAGTDEWRGAVAVPTTHQGPLEVEVTAWQGKAGTAGRALLLVDASLKATDLSLRPFNALPGQVVQLEAAVFGAAGRVTVRDESGKTILLTAGGARGYFADVMASTIPGTHTLTLLVDGQPAATATYTVLGRP